MTEPLWFTAAKKRLPDFVATAWPTDRRLDEFRGCERLCLHQLRSGVLLSELVSSDGPYEVRAVPVAAAASRAVQRFLDQQRGSPDAT